MQFIFFTLHLGYSWSYHCYNSSHLTNQIGDRAVPLLATLFLLSYMKLFHTIVTVLEFGVLIHYPDESKTIVWYLDENLLYCEHPHIYLFIISMHGYSNLLVSPPSHSSCC